MGISLKIEDLKREVKDYMKIYDVDFVSYYINHNCKREVYEKLIGAKLLLNNSFLFNRKWDMEQCRIPYLNKNLDWDFTPNGDEEWIFMLNRQEYFENLIVAYYYTKEDRYLNKLKDLIFDWIDKNEINTLGGVTIRTIDTGIRCLSWIKSLITLINEDKLNDDEILKIVSSIKEQLNYLKNSYTLKYTLSNWGVLQTTSIIVCILWLKDFIEDEDLFNWALEELYSEINLQVLEDGSHWEQSIMYHIEVLNAAMEVIHYSNYFNLNLDFEFLEKIHSMAKYLVYCGDSNSFFVAQGDSDRSDIRDVILRASILFRDPFLKFRAYEDMDLENILFFGKDGFLKYINIDKKEIKILSKSFLDSGNIYIRSSWDEDASFTYLQNGTLGSGHGHSDLGHFSISYGGESFLVDSGRYTYVEEDPLREYLKSAKAHNVSIIDDSPFAIPKNSWKYDKYAEVIKNYFKEKENIAYAEMAYLATLKDNTPYTVLRKVLVISKDIWVIVNEVRCSGHHICKNYYNLDNNIKIVERNGIFSCISKKSEINIYNRNVDKKYIENSFVSKNYNSINNSKRIVTEKAFYNNFVNYDIILGQGLKNIEIKEPSIVQYNSKELLSEDILIAKEFVIKENESYTIIIFNKETFKGAKVYICDDLPLYGKVLVIHNLNNKKRIIRLKA